MNVFCAVPQNPCAITIAMSADPVKAGAAALGDLDEIRSGAGFSPNRSGRESRHRHGHCRETDQTNNRQHRYTHVVLRRVARHHITSGGGATEYRSDFAESRYAGHRRIRFHHRRRRLCRLRAGQPPDRRPHDARAAARGGRQGPQPVDPHPGRVLPKHLPPEDHLGSSRPSRSPSSAAAACCGRAARCSADRARSTG